MSRKYIYLFTILLLSLFHVSAVQAVVEDFPVSGGTTSDGIVIVKKEMKNLQKSKVQNSIHVGGKGKKAKMSFSITVPEGKVAVLSYQLMLDIFGRDDFLEKANIKYKVTLDKQVIKNESRNVKYEIDLHKISLDEGSHNINFEATFTVPLGCSFAGVINDMTIHVHQYGDMEVTKEALCGTDNGTGVYTCKVCGSKKQVDITPKFKEHKLIKSLADTHSCLDNQGEVTKCENCPYTEIKRSKIQEHQFDKDRKCTVCGLHKPKCNSDSTVYEIYDAGEMRVLSELVSLGKIPGNVGVDIKADLVFDKIPMLPLGCFTNPFSGVLNGNGHRISGITNCFMDTDCLGFVGVAKGTMLSHAVIANLIFDGGNTLRGMACVGGIVGNATFCDILNCASFGTLQGTSHVAGIVGFANQQVSIVNCASVNTIQTEGNWNPMACRMTMGQILNSYGATTIENGGTLDSLSTATLRHCFSTHGDAPKVTRITKEMLTSYEMEEWLSEESESIPFMMSQKDLYPIPVVNTTITAQSNGPVVYPRKTMARRADSSDDDDDSEKDHVIDIMSGYVDENDQAFGKTLDEIKREDYLLHDDYNLVYVATRTVPEGYKLYDQISGGNLMAFESYQAPADSAFIKMREYDLVAPGLVKPVSEIVDDLSGPYERIDHYDITDNKNSLKSRIILDGQFNITCQKNIGDVLKTVWTIETKFDDAGNPLVTNAFSHNVVTGEILLENSYTYPTDTELNEEDETYREYYDSKTNTIHVILSYSDSITNEIESRDHYILTASDLLPLEVRTEKMVNGEPTLVDGSYYIYNEDGYIMQVVCFGPDDENDLDSEVIPYLYEEYTGKFQVSSYPTAIQLPKTGHQSLQKHADTNIYDMQGRLVRRVTDSQDPFSGLPRGVYLYQGLKYLKR